MGSVGLGRKPESFLPCTRLLFCCFHRFIKIITRLVKFVTELHLFIKFGSEKTLSPLFVTFVCPEGFVIWGEIADSNVKTITLYNYRCNNFLCL